MPASYALELHALKTELQRTLARLGVDLVSSDDTRAFRYLDERQESATQRSWRRPTRWNRRQLTREVAAASQRRKELERQLQLEVQRREDVIRDLEPRSERTAWQTAMQELQQQRATILQQMAQDTKKAAYSTVKTQELDVQKHELLSSPDENQYSIGGVVTLAPLSSSQQGQVAPCTTSGSCPSLAAVHGSKIAIASTLDPYLRCQTSPDTLNDVFSLQLKFAETMLKLERSVQIRDHLLQHGASRHDSRRQTRLHASVSSQSHDSQDNESFSSSAFSLDSTLHPDTSLRVRAAHFGVSRDTTAETLGPSVSNPENALESETMEEKAQGSRPAATLESYQEDSFTTDVAREQEEMLRTPPTNSSVTTPTTGSDDRRLNTSYSKQVRFDSDAYSTPVIARKFTFDGPSIEEDDDKEQEHETASVLSLLNGSSVRSAELNSPSFLRAFARFRRELNVSRHSSMQSPNENFTVQFAAQVSSNFSETPMLGKDLSTGTNEDEHPSAFPELDEMSLNELQERRKELCLDIQAKSAQLVLSYGEMPTRETTSGSEGAEHSKTQLMALRQELQAIDACWKRKKE